MSKLGKRFPLYSWFLKLYPAPYQKRYGQGTLQTLADMLDDPENSRTVIWARAAVDLPLSLLKQNLIYTGGILKNETPDYVKRNTLISAGLISPFFIFIIANGLTRHSAKFSSAGQAFFLFLILGLPAIALVLSLLTFARWAAQRHSIWKSLIDIRRNWPIAVTAGLAAAIVLFIPFHDSTHCLAGNPVKELRNFSQTSRCIAHG